MADSILTSGFSTTISDPDHTGSLRNLKLYDKYVIPDISDIITEVDPQTAPFMRLLEVIGSKQSTDNFKFEWLEEENKGFKTTVKNGSGCIGSNSNTDLQTDDNDLFVVDDILLVTFLTAGANYGASEIVRVTTKTSASVYVVERSSSGTTATTNIAAGDEVIKIGSSHAENSLQANPDSIEPVWYWNYTQNFKSSVAISGRMDAQMFRGTKNELMRQMRFRMRDHNESMENAFIWGKRAQSGTRTYTGGVINWIDTYAASGNTIDASGDTFSEGWLDSNANKFFRYGSDKKVAIVGGELISKLGVFGKEYLTINDKASAALGMEVLDYHSSHGKLSFIHSRTFDESVVYSKGMLIIDPKFIKKRYMNGRDTHINMNVQENGRDGTIHEICSDCGLEVRLPNAHFWVTGLDNTITP